MGVDSGLPDFRGSEGFWKAYPPYQNLGYTFTDLSNPRRFVDNPELAWGFYGHRLHLYRDTKPHVGFQILRKWCERVGSHWIYTSNVDGHFQRAGFSEQLIEECHGTINFLQCRGECPGRIFPADGHSVTVDHATMLAQPPFPVCDQCGLAARPNVLMFYDRAWVPDRTDQQADRFEQWQQETESRRIVSIELGAGTAIPTVRHVCEAIARPVGNTLIRINPRDSFCANGISIPLGALEALNRIDAVISSTATF